jgi:hypothetical protein
LHRARRALHNAGMVEAGARTARYWAVALAAVTCLDARALHANEVATLLEWRAPAGCPDARAVERSLAAEQGHVLAALAGVGKVSGTIEPRDSGWLLTIELVTKGERSSRLISAERCDDLADAAAVAIGLALEQQQASAGAPAEHAGHEPRALGATSAAASELPGADAAPASDRVAYRLAFGADLVMDLSSLPSVTPGVGVHARVGRERWQLALYGAFLPPRELALGAEQGVDFSLLAGGARGCFSALESALFPAACAGVELGRFSADGVGLRDARRADNLWLAPAAGLELNPELWHGVFADVRADALLPLIRKHYAVNDSDDVFRPPPVALRFYLGLSLITD